LGNGEKKILTKNNKKKTWIILIIILGFGCIFVFACAIPFIVGITSSQPTPRPELKNSDLIAVSNGEKNRIS